MSSHLSPVLRALRAGRVSEAWRLADHWIVSPRGRLIVRAAIATGVVVYPAVNVACRIYTPGYLYAYMYEMCDVDGAPVKLPPHLERMAAQEFTKFWMGTSRIDSSDVQSIEDREKNRAHFYLTGECDPLATGSNALLTGSHHFLPVTFGWTSLADARRHDGLIRDAAGMPLALTDDLCDSLVLSDRAKRFVILRDLFRRNSIQHSTTEPILWCSAYVVSSGICASLNHWLNLFKRVGRPMRMSIYAGVFTLFTLARWNWTAAHLFRSDGGADKEAAGMSADYAAGGLEYYRKVLKRNRALRKHMGAAGAAFYTEAGDVTNPLWPLLKPPVTSFVQRGILVRKILNEFVNDDVS